ncbi:MAG: hypothetical protein PUB42_03460 [Firmicutes bacterium]|nr:hypothetical protein [Bacillota bacterium]
MNKNDKFDLIAAPMPGLKEGDLEKFSFQSLSVVKFGASITTSCKNLYAAYKLLNYDYSEKGSILFNFGIEGEIYKMEN